MAMRDGGQQGSVVSAGLNCDFYKKQGRVYVIMSNLPSNPGTLLF